MVSRKLVRLAAMNVVSADALPTELLTETGTCEPGCGEVKRLQFDAVPMGEGLDFGDVRIAGCVQDGGQAGGHRLEGRAGRHGVSHRVPADGHRETVVLPGRNIRQRLGEVPSTNRSTCWTG